MVNKITKYLFLLLLFFLPVFLPVRVFASVYLGASVKATTVNITAALDASSSNTLTLSGTGASVLTNSGTFTCSTGTVAYEGTANTDVGALNGASHYYNLTLGAASDNNTVVFTAGGEIEASGSVTITSGGTGIHTLSQGNNDIGAGAVTVQSGGEWSNMGTGDLRLGGTFANSGSVSFDSSDAGCTVGSDDILIRSNSTSTQRSWTSSGGTFYMYNVDVQDQAGTASITVYKGTGAAQNNGTNWTFTDTCAGQSGGGGPPIRLEGKIRIKGGTRLK